MVKNRLKIFLFLFFMSAAIAVMPNRASASNKKEDKIVIVEKKAPIKQHKKVIVPTIILGILTFILVLSVFFVRVKVSKEIKKRRNRK